MATSDRLVEGSDFGDAFQEVVRECDVTGRRTVVTREGRAVAVVVSWDEYLAMRETIEIASDAGLMRDVEVGEDDARRNALLCPEDLFVE